MEDIYSVGQKFIATIDDSKEDIKNVAKDFENQGVKVEKVLAISGIITGITDNLDALWAKREELHILHLEKPKVVQGF